MDEDKGREEEERGKMEKRQEILLDDDKYTGLMHVSSIMTKGAALKVSYQSKVA